jgi:hypothetical protein
MIVELLKQEGRIVGAVGIPMESDDAFIVALWELP